MNSPKSVLDQFPPLFMRSCKLELMELRSNVPGVKSALIATADGFLVASSAPDSHDEKMVAVGSSMIAMGSALVFETGFEGCESLTIEAKDGRIFVRAIPFKPSYVILMVTCRKDTTLAHVLNGVRNFVNEVSTTIPV